MLIEVIRVPIVLDKEASDVGLRRYLRERGAVAILERREDAMSYDTLYTVEMNPCFDPED